MADTPSGLRVRDIADAALSGSRLLVRNVTEESLTLSIEIGRDGRRGTATVTLPAGAGRTVEVPTGEGPVTVEVRTEGADATITFGPGGPVPLFFVRDSSVLVAPN